MCGKGTQQVDSTDIRQILLSEKFGVIVTNSFSARNSTSDGSILPSRPLPCHHPHTIANHIKRGCCPPFPGFANFTEIYVCYRIFTIRRPFELQVLCIELEAVVV